MQDFYSAIPPQGSLAAAFPPLGLDNPNFEDNFVLNQLCRLTKNKDKIYKFQSPCKNPLYKKGDSLCEEIGVSRPTLRRQLDQVCTRYNSKAAFLRERDPWKGLPFCSYLDRIRKVTWYIKNPKTPKNFFSQFYFAFTSPLPGYTNNNKQITNFPPLPPINSEIELKDEGLKYSSKKESEKNLSENLKPEPLQKKSPLTATASPPQPEDRALANPAISEPQEAGAPQEQKPHVSRRQKRLMREQEKARNLGKRNRKKQKPTLKKATEKNFQTASAMRKIYIEATNNKIPVPSLGRKGTELAPDRLVEVLNSQFSGSLEEWRNYAESIGGRAYLCEKKEGSGFQAWLCWALRPENIEKVQAGLGTQEYFAGKSQEKPRGNSEVLEELLALDISNALKHKLVSLAEKVGFEKYKLWFEKLEIIEGNVLRLVAPTSLIVEHLKAKFSPVLEETLGGFCLVAKDDEEARKEKERAEKILALAISEPLKQRLLSLLKRLGIAKHNRWLGCSKIAEEGGKIKFITASAERKDFLESYDVSQCLENFLGVFSVDYEDEEVLKQIHGLQVSEELKQKLIMLAKRIGFNEYIFHFCQLEFKEGEKLEIIAPSRRDRYYVDVKFSYTMKEILGEFSLISKD